MSVAQTTKRAEIVVDIGVEEALARIEASFERAKTSTSRAKKLDHGWTIERQGAKMLIYPKHRGDVLLEPLPEDHRTALPETAALRIEATALPSGGTRVSARLVRRRVGVMAMVVGLDGLSFFAGFPPFVETFIHGFEMVRLRRNRRAARLRLLRLAIEPLLPHELASKRGPFRS